MLSTPASTKSSEDMLLRIIRVAVILVRVQFEITADDVDAESPEHKTEENRMQKHRSDASM